jgi:hypothetical protein
MENKEQTQTEDKQVTNATEASATYADATPAKGLLHQPASLRTKTIALILLLCAIGAWFVWLK